MSADQPSGNGFPPPPLPPQPAAGWQQPTAPAQPAAPQQPAAPTQWGYPQQQPTYPQAAPYAQQTNPMYGQQLQSAPPQQGGAGIGRIALLLSLVASVGGTIVMSVSLFLVGATLGRSQTLLETLDPAVPSSLAPLTPARDAVLTGEITFWVATVLGVWAIVQGIVAIAKRRGRGTGIAAIIISVIGPFVAVGVASIVFFIGYGAGLSA